MFVLFVCVLFVCLFVFCLFVFCLFFCLLDLHRRNLDLDERKYLVGRGVVTETQSNMGKYDNMYMYMYEGVDTYMTCMYMYMHVKVLIYT